jgi:hypothetical protein
VSRLLEIGQFLLGQLALATVSHNQLLVVNMQALDSAASPQFPFQFPDRVCQGPVACRFVVGVSRFVVVGDLNMVETRKLERQAVVV